MYANAIIEMNEKALATTTATRMKKLLVADFDSSFFQDNLQDTYESLLNRAHKFLFSERYFNLKLSGRKIDRVRKDNPLDFVAEFVGELEPAYSPAYITNLQIQEVMNKAKSLLTPSNYEIFQLFLQGWTGSEIGEIFKIKKAAVSRRLGRIIEKLGLENEY